MNDVYQNIDDYNSNKKYKIFDVFDNIIPDITIAGLTELFIFDRKLQHFSCFYCTVIFH